MQSIQIAGAKPHPTKLVQSAAMASVRAPIPSYRPLLPKQLIEDGVLSDAQIETVIYAGEAHAEMLAGRYLVDESLDNLEPRQRRRRERGAVPQGLFPRRRHRQRQRPPGRGHHSRQLAARTPQGGVDFKIRQADRGRAARLVGARPGKAFDRAAIALPPGHADPHRRRHSVHDLRDACVPPNAKARARGSSRCSIGSAPDSTA